MSHQSELISTDIQAYLKEHEQKELLRLLTCGSVDDGKSTLIGRLLHDSKMIYEDQLEAIKADSIKSGTTGEEMDLALLVDGLQAEREQGITIDVAYRYFSTSKRKFIIADTPGHEQYTRNMATGASTCNLAIILVDARHGVQVQTKRHSFIASLLGIKHIVLAVNKMDLVNYDQKVFENIQQDYTNFVAKLGLDDIQCLPLSALAGDNVVNASDHMPWYKGETLMHYLENLPIAADQNLQDMRLPVQYVNRPNLNFRGYCGTLSSGIVKKGEQLTALPSGKSSTVKSIITYDGELQEAFAPMAITIVLEDELDISRGDMLAPTNNLPTISKQFDAMIVWMAEDPLLPGKQYYIKHGTKSSAGNISSIRYLVDVNTLHQHPAAQLDLNAIARCEVSLETDIAFDDYQQNRSTGAFIIIDRISNVTVGAGMILLDESADHSIADTEQSPVSAEDRATRYGQQPALLVFDEKDLDSLYQAERKLFDHGRACAVLTQENTTSLEERLLIASAMNQAGLIVLITAPTSRSIKEYPYRVVDVTTKQVKEIVNLLK